MEEYNNECSASSVARVEWKMISENEKKQLFGVVNVKKESLSLRKKNMERAIETVQNMQLEEAEGEGEE